MVNATPPMSKYPHKYPAYGQSGKPFGREFTFNSMIGQAHMTEKEWKCIKDFAHGKDYLEIGSCHGYSTSAAYEGKAKSICCIDYNKHQIPFSMADQFIHANSLEAYKELQPNSFDLILIDGNHTAEYVAADLEHYYPCLRQGGLIMFHDYGMGGTYLGVWGVAEVVDAFFKPTQYIKTVDSLIIFRKD